MKSHYSSPLTVLGLTGGIACGKSLVADEFRKAGIPVINMDKLGRTLTESRSDIRDKIETICKQPVQNNGKLDRKLLRNILFSDAAKKSQIEALLHPVIRQNFWDECEKLAKQEKEIVICEAALLIEHGFYKQLDGLIVVLADLEVRKKRLIERDGISETLADQILRAQTEDNERKKAATYVIENNGSLEQLQLKVKSLVPILNAHFSIP